MAYCFSGGLSRVGKIPAPINREAVCCRWRCKERGGAGLIASHSFVWELMTHGGSSTPCMGDGTDEGVGGWREFGVLGQEKRKGRKLVFLRYPLCYRHKVVLEGQYYPHLNDEGAVTQSV